MKTAKLKPITFASCFVLAFSICQSGAQSERMEELKKTYEAELKKVIEPVDRQYEKALLNLQKKFISENRLEDALLVKKEIEMLKDNKVVQTEPTPSGEGAPKVESPAGNEPGDKVALDFKGDHEVVQEDGDTTFVLEGQNGGVRMMTLPINDIKKRFPNGLRVRYQYKSDGFVGQGVETRMEFPSLRGLFTYRNPTLKLNGEWNEYTWPFSDTKDQDMMNFQVLLENGEGTVAFRNFEFLAN